VFSETVSRLLEPEKYLGRESEKMGETSRGDLGAVIETSEPASEVIHGKKALRQRTSPRCRDQLFRDSGVTPLGPQKQSPSENPLRRYLDLIGPLCLSVRPLSIYQQWLIDTIFRLKSENWTERQIANHFNDLGYLTPRGYRWIPQSVFSIQKKYQRRLARLGEGNDGESEGNVRVIL